MSKPSDYERLARITNTAMDSAQAKMQALLAEEEALRSQLASLQSARHQMVQNGGNTQAIGADVKWQVWIDHRREELNHELVRVFVQKDAARSALKRAFGKDQTVQALLKRQRLAKLLAQRRQLS